MESKSDKTVPSGQEIDQHLDQVISLIALIERSSDEERDRKMDELILFIQDKNLLDHPNFLEQFSPRELVWLRQLVREANDRQREPEPDLTMVGHQRYKPPELTPFFGYDRLAYFYSRVELALIDSLIDIGLVPSETVKLLTEDVRKRILAITTTKMDEREKKTKHDIRALIQLIREVVPEPLRPWVHFGATSYDIVCSANALMYQEAYLRVIEPSIIKFGTALSEKVGHYAKTVQAGRTHGQHAVPITVGFWLASILGRICDILPRLHQLAHDLPGKMSGPVGAKNCLPPLGIKTSSRPVTLLGNDVTYPILNLEQLVMRRLLLETPLISTQIVPPEPLTRFLHELVLLSGALAQLANDCRQLQRTEIDEVGEEFNSDGQVGSSTMPHKRNPITFENTVGMFNNVRQEFDKVLLLLTSEHQRDLTGSSIIRWLPTIPILVQYQLGRLTPVIGRLIVNQAMLESNLRLSASVMTAELAYLALQLAGYPHDAHELINQLATRAKQEGQTIPDLLKWAARGGQDPELAKAYNQIPADTLEVMEHPHLYIGESVQICAEVQRQFTKIVSQLYSHQPR